MASDELMHAWNREDESGKIEPPLSEVEVGALSAAGVEPETILDYAKDKQGLAREAMIACGVHIRIPGDPEETAAQMAEFIVEQ